MTPTANTFEDRLLDALLDRFDAQPHERPADLVSAPRRANVRRYALPVGCLAAAAAATAVILVGGPAPVKHVKSTTPSYALAAWTTNPTSSGRAQISAADTLCSANFAQNSPSQPEGAQKQGPPEGAGPWNPVVVDTRGNLTLELYGNGTRTVACLAGPSFVSLSEVDATGEPAVSDKTASLDKVSTRQASGDLYTVAVGRTGPGVTAVGLERVDGSAVTATVGNGRFIAWWPDAQGVKAISVTTTAGTQNYPVDEQFARSGPQPNNKTVHSLSDQPDNKSS
jgi:hypothetical protein